MEYTHFILVFIDKTNATLSANEPCSRNRFREPYVPIDSCAAGGDSRHKQVLNHKVPQERPNSLPKALLARGDL